MRHVCEKTVSQYAGLDIERLSFETACDVIGKAYDWKRVSRKEEVGGGVLGGEEVGGGGLGGCKRLWRLGRSMKVGTMG